MGRINKVLLGLVFTSIIVVAAVLCSFIRSLQLVVESTPPMLERQIALQGDLTRSALTNLVDTKLTSIQSTLSNELKLARNLVHTELDQTRQSLTTLVSSELTQTRGSILSISSTLDSRLSSIQSDLSTNLSRANLNLETQLTDFNGTLRFTLAPVTSLTAKLNDTAPLFLDCDHNADCLFNRWVGMSRGVEELAISSGKISTDVSILTHKFVQPTPWYKQALNYLGVAGIAAAKIFN
jgi:hypothetical protein